MRKALGAFAWLIGGFTLACFTEVEPLADPIEECRTCSSERCTKYYDACVADSDCNECFSRPKSLECLGSSLFQAAANCSCEDCASDCTYMCPGGQGACDSCSNTTCSAEGNACLADVTCAPCLEDPFREGCAEHPLAMAATACSCETCGQECIWLCPAAGNACAACISMSCPAEFDTCVTDVSCMDCFENPANEGCEEHVNYGGLTGCMCTAETCNDVCDLLFCTPPA